MKAKESLLNVTTSELTRWQSHAEECIGSHQSLGMHLEKAEGILGLTTNSKEILHKCMYRIRICF